MRLSVCILLAALSALALCHAATRPRYGGTLRVEMQAAPAALDPSAADAAPLTSSVFEPLVRLDATGAVQPWLALDWQHDATSRRWQFHLRSGVRFQDGSELTAAAALPSLETALPGVPLAAAGDTVVIRASRPMPGLLLDLAQAPIFTRDAEGHFAGTGPFRPAAFDPGRRAIFAANDDYWGGRPFVDAIEVQLGRGLRDQLVDLELGKADVVELAPSDFRRATAHAGEVWSSAARRLVALAFAPGREDVRLRDALALSIDRAAMHDVLLQKQGEVCASLLPEWISGYAFAFSTAPDLVRARALAAAVPPANRVLMLSYDPAMPAARSLADRVAVNARDAGVIVHVTPQNARAAVRLMELRLPSPNPGRALAGIAAALGLEAPRTGAGITALYESESRLLEGSRVIPLFYLPDLYAVASRVRVYAPPAVTRLGEWRFGNIWLSGTLP